MELRISFFKLFHKFQIELFYRHINSRVVVTIILVDDEADGIILVSCKMKKNTVYFSQQNCHSEALFNIINIYKANMTIMLQLMHIRYMYKLYALC